MTLCFTESMTLCIMQNSVWHSASLHEFLWKLGVWHKSVWHKKCDRGVNLCAEKVRSILAPNSPFFLGQLPINPWKSSFLRVPWWNSSSWIPRRPKNHYRPPKKLSPEITKNNPSKSPGSLCIVIYIQRSHLWLQTHILCKISMLRYLPLLSIFYY